MQVCLLQLGYTKMLVAELQQWHLEPSPAAAETPDTLLSDAAAVHMLMDELLLFTILVANSGGPDWRGVVNLYQQFRGMHGPRFAASNGVMYGMLFELLVGTGGVEGLLAAMEICSDAHVTGEGDCLNGKTAGSAQVKGLPGPYRNVLSLPFALVSSTGWQCYLGAGTDASGQARPLITITTGMPCQLFVDPSTFVERARYCTRGLYISQ